MEKSSQSGSDELRDELTEQDRADAIEHMTHAISDLERELAVVDALDQHRVQTGESRNLGYYRTFIECSCGAGWWFGYHEGDPSAGDRWDIHRAGVIRDALEAEVERRVADAWDEGQKSGLRYTDRMRAAYEAGRPELPGPPSVNPYRAVPSVTETPEEPK